MALKSRNQALESTLKAIATSMGSPSSFGRGESTRGEREANGARIELMYHDEVN